MNPYGQFPKELTKQSRQHSHRQKSNRQYQDANIVHNGAKVPRNQREFLKEYVYQNKVENGCSQCPERRPSTLQYHHRDKSTKLFEISAGVKARITLQQMKDEIAKCDLVCANCHMIAERGDGYKVDKYVADLMVM